MRKKAMPITPIFTVIILTCFALAIPLRLVETTSANVVPYADSYGFVYPDGFYSIYHVDAYTDRPDGNGDRCYPSYSFRTGTWRIASGVETLFEQGYPYHPSTHKALCYNGWPSTYYGLSTAQEAYDRLPGNAMFNFFGHGVDNFNGALSFYNFHTGEWSTISGSPNSGGPPPYISSLSNNACGDVCFSMMLCCKSGVSGGPAAWLSFKGADTVLGWYENIVWKFNGNVGGQNISVYPMHIYNEYFWNATQIMHWNVQQAVNYAFDNTKVDYGGRTGWLDCLYIFGDKYQYIDYPHDGRLFYPWPW